MYFGNYQSSRTIFNPEENGEYTLVATDANGCQGRKLNLYSNTVDLLEFEDLDFYNNPSSTQKMKLYYHSSSSASLRVLIFLSCRGIPDNKVKLIETGIDFDNRGIPIWTIPSNDEQYKKLKTNDYKSLNPEGRVPLLLLEDGKKMTQTGAIIDLIDDLLGEPSPLIPEDPYLKAEMRRIQWIVAADTQPYQNIPFIIQAMGEWGMKKAQPIKHPLRKHFINREFSAIEEILENVSGKFCVGDNVSYADCFLIPQIRNALASDIPLEKDFPNLNKVWKNMLALPQVLDIFERAGGIIQPIVVDEKKLKEYVE